MQQNISSKINTYSFFSVLVFLSSYFLLTDAKAQIFYVLSVIGIIWLLIVKRGRLISVDSTFIFLILFLVYFSLSTLWSSAPGADLLKTIRHSLYIVIGLIIFIWAFRDKLEKNNKILLYVIIGSASLSFLLTLVTTPSQFTDHLRLTHVSLLGLTGNPIHTGVYFGTASLAAVSFYRMSQKTSITLASLGIAFALLLFVFLTKSRGAILFYFLAVTLMMIMIKPQSRKRDYFLLGMFMAGAVLMYLFFINTIVARMEEPNYRLQLLSASWNVIKQNIWFGSGINHDDFLIISTGEVFTKAHNSFVQCLQVGGIVGFTIMAALVTNIIYIGFRAESPSIKFTTVWLVYGASILAIDGDLLIDRPSREWFCFWIPFFIIAAYRQKQLSKTHE